MPIDTQFNGLDDLSARLKRNYETLNGPLAIGADQGLTTTSVQPFQTPTLESQAAGLDSAAGPQGPAPATITQAANGKPADKQAPKLQFTKKAEDASTVHELISAAKPSSLNNYMDWWEKQNGAIDHKYDYMRQQLGDKAPADRPLSRKDKFSALMDFGINLIKASNGRKYDTEGAYANAIGATVEQQGQKRDLEGKVYNDRLSGIESGRAVEKKNLGNYGEALKGQADISMRNAQQSSEEAKLQKTLHPDPETIYADQGIHQLTPGSNQAKPVLGIDGKPLTNLKVGSHGASAASRDDRTAKQKDYEFLISKGKDPAVAEIMAYNVKTGDPRKDHLTVYKSALTATFGNEAKAKQIADEYIGFAYPQGTSIQTDSPGVRPQQNDPEGIRDLLFKK